MTDAVAIALITGAVTVVGSAITAVVSIRNGRKADRLELKTDVINKHTNGTLTELTEQLKTANETIAGMSKTMEKIAPTDR